MSLLDSEIEVIDKVSIKDIIIEWLKKYNIKNYKINDDLTVDVNGNVGLYGYSESQLPDYIQFNRVNGWFDISQSQIKSLNGAPNIVKCSFFCHHCKNLKSLKGAPEMAEGGFDCSYCDSLKSLKGAPEIVYGFFDYDHCKNLKSLKGAPKQVKKNFYYVHCDSLKTLKGTSKIVKGKFDCSYCPNLKITKLEYKKYKITK